MHSVKCPSCGFVAWSGVENCKKCGASLTGNGAGDSIQPQQGFSYAGNRSHPQRQLKKGLAIFALVLGIFNLFTLGLLGFGALVGIVVAIVAMSNAKRSPAVYGGKELATAGLVTSIISVAIIVPVGIIAAIAIPNLLAARRAANEGATIAALRKIHSAEATYQSMHERFGSLEELVGDGLVQAELASGDRYGYRFKVTLSVDDEQNRSVFSAVGVPARYPSTGRRSFFVDESGVIRGADSQGTEATRYDAPLNFDSYDYSSAPRRSGYGPAPASGY